MDTLHTIYTITTIDSRRDHRTVGWFPTLNDAQDIVSQNIGDIWEFSYHWVVIEEVYPGLYPHTPNEYWYHWNTTELKFKPCDKPKMYHNTVNFGIG